MQPLQDKIAFVTGAGAGIGRAIAQRLAAEGARVAVADIDLARAQATEKLIQKGNGTAMAVQVDVTRADAVSAAVGQVHAAFGPIEILVNNAGWDKMELFIDNDPALWDRLIAINLKGVLYCCRAVVDDMIAAGRGKIVNISSDAARVGSTGEAVYAACKGGVISFSKSIARELARHHIMVNVVCPGPTNTPLIAELTSHELGAKIIEATRKTNPFRRLGEPEEIAGAVVFFASADADFITGQVLSVSGGLTMAG